MIDKRREGGGLRAHVLLLTFECCCWSLVWSWMETHSGRGLCPGGRELWDIANTSVVSASLPLLLLLCSIMDSCGAVVPASVVWKMSSSWSPVSGDGERMRRAEAKQREGARCIYVWQEGGGEGEKERKRERMERYKDRKREGQGEKGREHDIEIETESDI